MPHGITKAKQALIDDAIAAGFSIEEHGGILDIVKRSPKLKKVSCGLRLFEDGTAFDLTVQHLSISKGLRSYADMRKVLRIA